jgi:signal transduction histidine kinase
MMEGFDKDWIYSGKRRYANYTNLDPGEYIFKVIGTNSDGVWNKEGASINIIVYPPFWETWWFYLLSTIIIVSISFSIHRMVIRKKINQMMEHERIRTNEREKVREELSRDFHDELGHKLTRISMYTRNLKKKTNGSVPELMHELRKVNETSQSLYLGAKDLIWALNPGEDTLYDAVIRLKDFGDDLFDKTGINFGSKGIAEEFKSIKLPMEWKRHLVLIFKESMNNILKYAECENVLFKIESGDNNLKIILSDDGKGFEMKNETNGYGLNNIRKRAEKIKGSIQIISAEEKGTQIIFSSNIPHLSD